MKSYQSQKSASPRATVQQPPKHKPKPEAMWTPPEPIKAHSREEFQVGIDTFKKASRTFKF